MFGSPAHNPPQPYDDLGRLRRRTLLGAAGGLAIGIAGAQALPAAAAGSDTLFDPGWLVGFDPDPTFTFALNTSNAAPGEASPITAPYHLSKYKVTNAQYLQFLDDTGAEPPRVWPGGTYWEGKDRHPVMYLSAIEAGTYCDWLSRQHQDWTFRLPSEAEWENAARGPHLNPYPWGDTLDTAYTDGVLSSHCNYNAVCAVYVLDAFGSTRVSYVGGSLAGSSVVLSDLLTISATGALAGWNDTTTRTGFVYTDLFADIMAAGGNTSTVGSFPTGDTPTGLCDMGGDSWDWTSSTIVATNGQEKGQPVNAIRGGSWYASARSCATWYRGEGREPGGGANTVGFRLAAVPA